MKYIALLLLNFTCTLCFTNVSYANIYGGRTGNGTNVTVTDKGSTVILSNGIISATITKANATIANYSFNGYNMLSGGYNGGQIYWSWNMPNYQNPSGCSYTLNADPTQNNGDYAEVQLHMKWPGTATTAAIDVDVYYSLTRDANGIYAAAMLTHPANYPACPGGEWRMASYVGSTFDWLSVDSLRNKKMASPKDSTVAVTGAPKEVVLYTTGIYKNEYECKYDYSADLGYLDAWGWCSTTKNLGIWITTPSKEYYNGGPMKRELLCHSGPTLLNMLNGEHYSMGNDFSMDSTEEFKKVYGPFLIYCNSVPATTLNAPNVLFNDAKTQAKAEQAAWPYSWFTNPNYFKKNQRGTVTGKLIINDTTTSSIVASNIWVGIAVTPISSTGVKDFQKWAKNYQFWVQTDSVGNFTIPNVIPGKYNIYAFGSSAAGLMSKLNYLTVTADSISALGNVEWVPTRTAPTVWEIGIPDRSAGEYFHGKDWWTSNLFPNTHWAKFMDYPDEFPNGVNFNIGQSNIATDWNFVMNYDKTVQTTSPVWKVNFNLIKAPRVGTKNSALYVAIAGSFSSALIVKVNGTLITAAVGANPSNPSDAKIRKGIHGAFSDLRLLFDGSLLKAGSNSVEFTLRIGGNATVADVMFDYVRLEAPDTKIGDPLPISFLPLVVSKENEMAVLKWATISESNNDYFEVERSSNGVNFTRIKSIIAIGNSIEKTEYCFKDNQPLVGLNYYRIKQIDKNGKFTYGNVVSVSFSAKDNLLKLYPNPGKNNFRICFTANQEGLFLANIINTRGSIVKEIALNAIIGQNNHQLDLSELCSGYYTIVLKNKWQSMNCKFEKL